MKPARAMYSLVRAFSSGSCAGETTPDEIAQYYRTAGYQALGYNAHPEKGTSVTIRVNLCDEDGDIVDTHAVVTVEIPADYSA